ncbi:reticulon-2 isoform X2 [Cherax quadricarinatus]|uniref:reticulon-2 isoform X2 n=1 Tax=Cherax quadricarinatus TaxID=27406 RepID=UPI00387EA34B
MSEFDKFSNMPKADPTDPTPNQDPFSTGSNRDSLNLDDFEKVDADQLPPPSNQIAGTTSAVIDNIISQVSSTGHDLFSNFPSMPGSDTKPGIPSASPDPSSSTLNDPFKLESATDPSSKEAVPSKPSADLASVTPPLSDSIVDKPSQGMSQIDVQRPLADFIVDSSSQGTSQTDVQRPLTDFIVDSSSQGTSQTDVQRPLTDFIVDSTSQGTSQTDVQRPLTDFIVDSTSQGTSQADVPRPLTDFDNPSQDMSQTVPRPLADFIEDIPNSFTTVSSDSFGGGSVDLASAPPPSTDSITDKPSQDMDFDAFQKDKQFDDFMKDKPSTGLSQLDDFMKDEPSTGMSQFDDFMKDKPSTGMSQFDDFQERHFDDFQNTPSQGISQFDDFEKDKPSEGVSQFDFLNDKPSQGISQFDLIKDKPPQGMSEMDDFFAAGDQSSSFSNLMSEPEGKQPVTEPQSEDFLITKSQAPAMESILNPESASVTQVSLTPSDPEPAFKRDPTPPREPTPPRQPTPPPRQPTPPPRQPTPPPRQPTPPPRQPTPPPRQPTPPPRQPTPPPRQPTPPPRQPTPPPRQPTPPPRQPTPPPRQPTPPPRQPPREPTPPRKMSPPPMQVQEEVTSAPLQEANITQGKIYKVSDSTRKSLAVFNPLVDLIYWRDLKKTAVVFGAFLALLISLAYVSFISVVSYTSLIVLTVTIIYRVYKNIMQAIQKSQDGHPFKSLLELDTDLPQEKARDFSDAFVNWFNPVFSEIKRLFLVEDLVDSVKFGCLLWCLTYVGSWFNGLTLVTLAVVALFTLPKVYEQNQAQIDQYVGLVRNQVNDVMSKVKAALPIGNKEKTQ